MLIKFHPGSVLLAGNVKITAGTEGMVIYFKKIHCGTSDTKLEPF